MANQTNYRSDMLYVRDNTTRQLSQSPAILYGALQSLPVFMDNWRTEASKSYSSERLITATINVADGCRIGSNALCGQFCFSHVSWNGHNVKNMTPARYREDALRLYRNNSNVSIFLSTDTEPLPGVCDISEIALSLLKEMVKSPPHGIVLHTHTDIAARREYIDVLADLAQATKLLVGVGFETDVENVPDSLPRAYVSIEDRLGTIERLSARGIKTQAAVAPLVGFRDFGSFAKRFAQIGTYRVMVGDLRLSFATGGAEKAQTLKARLGLPAPTQEDAKLQFEALGFPKERVAFRDQFYVVLPE